MISLVPFFILAVALIFSKPSYEIHYYIYESGEYKWQLEILKVTEVEEVFNSYFENEKVAFIPEGTKLLKAVIIDDHLIIDVNENIKHYGGTFNEIHLKSQLTKTALQIPKVNKFTMYIEGTLQPLPEGLYIEEETTWDDLY